MLKNADVEKIFILKNPSILRYVECVFVVYVVRWNYEKICEGRCIMIKRDKRGRWVKRVSGEYSDRVYSIRLTDGEYQLVMRARDEGISPRKVLIETLREHVKVGADDKG
jgi:hypothetical protein